MNIDDSDAMRIMMYLLLSKMVGAGTASGSFDRDGYCV